MAEVPAEDAARAEPAQSRAVVAVPPARPEAGRAPTREGQPIIDLPPIIEPLEFAAVNGDRSLPVPPLGRPVRRRFLAPHADPSAPADDGPLPLARLRAPAVERRPPASDAASRPERPATDRAGAESTPEPRPQARRWRLVTVGGGIAAALAAAVAIEVGVDPVWFEQARAFVLLQLVPSAALRPGAAPPADPAGRVGFYTARARAGDAAAQVALAVIYAKGDGVGQDYAAAAKWFRAAAEQGVARAQYDLGVLYERGRGVPVDRAAAAGWYRKAAEQNHPLAQYNLAVAFTKGEGVPQDFFEAAVWYHRAAEQGVVAAMVNLAILYERGEGVERSAVDAYAWYRAAARRGSQPADRRAEALLQAFTPSEQTHAEARTAGVAGDIRDAIGARARLAARAAPAADSAGPALKSGLESGGDAAPSGEAPGENP